MTLDAGKLDRLVALQSASETNDADTNEVVESWSTYASVWARVEHHLSRTGSSDETEADGRRFASMDIFFTIRYRTDVEPNHRVIHDSETYTIEGFPREIGRRQYLKFKGQRVE